MSTPGGSLRVDSITAGYAGVARLLDVTFTLEPGQVLAVTGSAGAGKTTLLWALAGHLPLLGGTVTAPDAGSTTRAAHRAAPSPGGDIVLMAQGNALAGTLTAYENVLVPLLARLGDPAVAAARAQEVLTAVGLGEAGGQLIDELSGGQQQRVCVARGLAADGAVVLADEPTSAVDAANRAVIMRLLRGEADRGAVVIVATHDDETAAECDGEIHLVDGRMTWTRPLSRP